MCVCFWKGGERTGVRGGTSKLAKGREVLLELDAAQSFPPLPNLATEGKGQREAQELEEERVTLTIERQVLLACLPPLMMITPCAQTESCLRSEFIYLFI